MNTSDLIDGKTLTVTNRSPLCPLAEVFIGWGISLGSAEMVRRGFAMRNQFEADWNNCRYGSNI